MPPKVYLQSPPNGDFRAMPALGDGFAMLKWISSFPGNPARGLPTVMGVVLLSDAATSAPLAILDARSVTALRTGAVAAVAAQALAAPERASARDRRLRAARRVGGALPGGRRLRARRLLRPARRRRRGARRRSSGGLARGHARGGAGLRRRHLRDARARAGRRREDDLHAGMHLNMLGADGPGKAEATIDAVVACELFCDEWAQAAHGGELTGAVEAGRVSRAGRDRPRRRARPARPAAARPTTR